jgi:hypothetical protein
VAVAPGARITACAACGLGRKIEVEGRTKDSAGWGTKRPSKTDGAVI